jgi:ribosomal protein S12 methylthiotransferase accessory factor YcaO
LRDLAGVRQAPALHFGIDPLTLHENLKCAEYSRRMRLNRQFFRQSERAQFICQTGSLFLEASGFAVFDDDLNRHGAFTFPGGISARCPYYTFPPAAGGGLLYNQNDG